MLKKKPLLISIAAFIISYLLIEFIPSRDIGAMICFRICIFSMPWLYFLGM